VNSTIKTKLKYTTCEVKRAIRNILYRGNPKPSFLGVMTHILRPKTFILVLGSKGNLELMKQIPPKTRVFSGAGPFFHSRLAPLKNHAFYIYALASVYLATQAPKIGISWPSISMERPRVGENVSLNQITV